MSNAVWHFRSKATIISGARFAKHNWFVTFKSI
jgi:hypothetical protein